MKDIKLLESMLVKSISKEDANPFNFKITLPYVEVNHLGIVRTTEKIAKPEINRTLHYILPPGEIVAHTLQQTMRKCYKNNTKEKRYVEIDEEWKKPYSTFIGIVFGNLTIEYRRVNFDVMLAVAERPRPTQIEITQARKLAEQFLTACLICSEIAFLYEAFSPEEMDSILPTETKEMIKMVADRIDTSSFILPETKFEIVEKSIKEREIDLDEEDFEDIFPL